MKHKKNTKRRTQSPREIKRQIIEDLKRERDPIQRELLQQRLHHYNTLAK